MKKSVIITIVGITILLVSIFLIVWLPKSDLDKYIVMHNTYYCEKWKFKYTNVDNENQKLSIRFDKKSGAWNNNIDNIREIYEWLYNKVYENDSLREYSVDLDFVGIGEYFSIQNISYDLNQLEIWCNTAVDLKKISVKFSDATELYLSPAHYNDIMEIKGFSDLQYIYFSNALSDDEIATIKSCFPDCEFESGGY